MSNDLLRWRKQATPEQWENLAKLAGTSIGYLNQIAYGNRKASPIKAIQIEDASKQFPLKPINKGSIVSIGFMSLINQF